ncbi:MAG: hypothetical protein MJ050_01435 [Phascolarctobacterium sp.]|nr:hypothetical protein [Phascolarctobacterium sp.]
MKRVLLLSAPVGSGHIMAAKALEEELKTRENVVVKHGNVFDFLPHWLTSSFLKLYLGVLSLCPAIYGLAYSSGEGEQASFLWLRNLINKVMLKLGESYIKSFNPDIVIATHATPLGIMSLYKQQHPEVWLGAVVPDYSIHAWWNNPMTDMYFLADEELTQRITANAQTMALGLPLRSTFFAYDKQALRQRYCFEEQDKVVLIMGGGEGLLPMEKILQLLVKVDNVKVVAIAGNNAALAKKLQDRYIANDKIEIYGFREDIPQLMSAADIIVTKAGAVTAAEVLACDLSYIIYKPLPGQEEGNAKFLARKHQAMIAHSVQEIVNFVEKPKQLVQKGELTVEARRNATKKICDYILIKNR